MQAIQQEQKLSLGEDAQAYLSGEPLVQFPCRKVKSQYLPAYNKYLGGTYKPPATDCFSKRMIYYHKESIQPKAKETFALVKEAQLNQAEIVRYQVTMSHFQMKILLLNMKEDNPFLSYPPSQRGNYGRIYFYKYQEKAIAIKVFTYANPVHSFSSIKAAIKQYAIMKICAALGCGPNIESNFGFDLIAYNDSVMFCMEECVPVHHYTQEHTTSLKQSLRLMHAFKIIHFDIKPDNISFSPHFGKPVFIDFGFSEVVEQELGFKNLVQFRGSPGFCSEEMIFLLGKHHDKDYVDAYYNDIQALKKTLLGLKLSIGLQNAQEQSSQQPEYSDLVANLQKEEMGNKLLLIQLKFTLLAQQKDEIVYLLTRKKCFLLKEYGGVILNSFRVYLQHKTFEVIYRELRKELNDFVDPVIIENYFKFHFRDDLYQRWLIDEESLEEGSFSGFIARITPRNQQYHSVPFQRYREFLEIPNVFINQSTAQLSKSILIEYLRFDKKGLNVSDKISMANKFNHAVCIQPQQNFEAIKITFQHLFEYCLSIPITAWKKSNIFLILNQAFMVDLNIGPYFDRLISSLIQMHRSFKDMVDCWMQVQKIALMQSFKNVSDHECMEAIPRKLNNFGNEMLQIALKQYEKSNDKDTKHITRALNIFMCKTEDSSLMHQIHIIINELTMIQYGRFQKELIQLIYLEMLRQCYIEQTYEQIIYLHQMINHFSFFQIQHENSTFSYSVHFLYHIFAITKNSRQITRLFKNISSVINCPEVYSKYKFQKSIFVFSDERNPQKLFEITSQIFKSLKSLETTKLKDEIPQLMQKIERDLSFFSIYPEIIETIINSFMQYNEGYEPTGKFITSFNIEDMMYRYSILNFFLQFRPFIRRQYFQQILHKFDKKQSHGSEQQAMSDLEFINQNLYQSIKYDIMDLPIKKLQAFEHIYRHSIVITNMKLVMYALKSIIKIAYFENFKEKLLHYIIIFYNLSHDVPPCARFFQSGQNYLIAVTLQQLQSSRKLQDFYNFLTILAKFVTSFPSKKVIFEWNDNITQLMKEEGISQLMSYKFLSARINQIFWDNYYYVCYYVYSLQIETQSAIKLKIFAKIAENVNFLNTHAKQIVLPTFFKLIITQFQSSKRKFLYLTLRWGYKYLNNHEFLSNLKISPSKFGKFGKVERRLHLHHPKHILRQKLLLNLRGKEIK